MCMRRLKGGGKELFKYKTRGFQAGSNGIEFKERGAQLREFETSRPHPTDDD